MAILGYCIVMGFVSLKCEKSAVVRGGFEKELRTGLWDGGTSVNLGN